MGAVMLWPLPRAVSEVTHPSQPQSNLVPQSVPIPHAALMSSASLQRGHVLGAPDIPQRWGVP